MITRRLEENLRIMLETHASVALVGPRQTGKTTLAFSLVKTIQSLYLDLEDTRDLSKIYDVHTFYEENKYRLIILDEVQRLPSVFNQLRGIIDAERREGHRAGLFLFLGSASMELLRQSGESLAGRIAYLELHPLDVLELGGEPNFSLNRLWLRGGFPESYLSLTDRQSIEWRSNFITTYLERDIPQIGPKIPSETLERFWTMLAHKQGSIFNASQLSKSLEVSAVTVSRYLDFMVDLLLIRRLQPWTYNMGKRLIRSPKVYVRDSGITHALLNISDFNSLLSHPVAGGSWEGFVIENIHGVLPQRARSYYYSTAQGAEIDLVLEFASGEKWAIEIKRNTTPSLSKGFYIACEDISAAARYLVYGGSEKFAMGNVTVIPLDQFMQLLLALND